MKKKIFSILLALVASIGFSWAQTEVLLTTITLGSSSTPSANPEGVATVSAVGVNSRSAMFGWLIYDNGSITIEAQNGYTITRCVFRQDAKEPITVSAAPFAIHWVQGSCVENNSRDRIDGVTSVEVYGYESEPATEPEPEPEPQPAEPIVVEWNSSNLPSDGNANPFTLEGVTLAGGNMSADWYERYFTGSGTFTTDLGNFTKIEITADASNMSGEGWSGGTWTGNAASVSFDGYIYGYDSGVRFVFTIEPAAAPEPEPGTPTPILLTTINSSENTDFLSNSKTFDDKAVVTFSRSLQNYGDYWGWFLDDENATISVTAAEGYTITSCKFYCAAGNAEDTQAPFEAKLYGYTGDLGELDPYSTVVNGNSIGTYGVTKIEVYGYQNSAPEPEPEPEPQPAQEESLLTTFTLGGSSTPSVSPEGFATISAVGVNSRSNRNGWILYGNGSFTIEAQNGYTITRCVFRQSDKEPVTVSAAPFAIHFSGGRCDESNSDMDGVTSIEVYGYATPEPQPEPEPQGQTISGGQDPQNTTYYYSTFFDSQVKYELPAGVEAYVATISGDALTLTRIAVAGQTIPANNAVIFRATANEFTLTPSTADAVTFSATNSLQGTDIEINNVSDCYVLSDEDGVIGFYKYTGNQLNAHKAYITYTAPNNAPRRMRFIFAEEQNTTALDNAETDNMSVKVIENGQLVIVRNGVRYNAAGQVIE